MAASVLAFGIAQLHLDGMLIVKGLPLDGSQVIVITKDGEAQVLNENLSHFTLNLELQKEYLVSFERPGCVSKQLRFNTNVPISAVNPEGFRFPFQVTLEPSPQGQHIEYAGPVGYIQYDKKLNDFSYSTDYRMLKDDFLAKELEVVQTKLRSTAAPSSPLTTIPADEHAHGPSASTRSLVRIEPVTPVAPYEVIAPVVSRTAPMVHVLGNSEIPAPGPLSMPEPVPSPMLKQAREVAPLTEPERPVIAVRAPEPKIDEPTGMETEVQVDSLRVITITRFRKGTDTDEYRRVVSYYGGTTYFCNGYACSADTYQREVNR